MPKNIKCNGINSELINWLRDYKHLESILPDINDFETDLIPAICDKDHRKRVAHSKEVIKILWYNHPVLGPYPFLETLSDFEFDRQFYQGYRDHASHQLKVYLLGLYFFEKSPLINKAIIDELQISNNKEAIREFHLRWLITAVYHDIGYVIENEQTNELDEKVWDKTKKVLNETLHTPLCYLPKFGKTLSREREEQIIQNNGIFYPTVKHPVDIEKDKSCKDLLNLISEDAIKANLGIVTENVSSPLRSYYEFAYKTKAKDGRPKFRDHGIASSLLLLKVWRSFNDYIEQLCLLTNEELLKSSLSEILALKSSLKGFDKTIYAAAGAISLHNLNKDIWDESEAIKHHLTLKEYWLRLENDNGNKATPLAFLLGLVDSIQCWDRPMYNNPTTKDKQITDEDIEMSYVDGKIFISFKEDATRFKRNPKVESDSYYTKLFNLIYKYVDQKSVNKIIDCPSSTSVKPSVCKIRIKKNKGKRENKSSGKQNILEPQKIEVAITKSKTDIQKVYDLIDNYKGWLVGAVNFDEDLHFSSFYLYQSWKQKLPNNLKKFGYESLIACYKGFKEIYFIPESECKRVAESLIKSITENHFWFYNILDAIKFHADELLKVFPFKPDSKPFEGKTNYELAEYYTKHNIAHTKLYEFSRLPEALDRGKNYFTNHLRNYLRDLHKDFTNRKNLNEVFEIFTFPEEISIAGKEFVESIKILNTIRNSADLKELFGTSTRNIILKLDPKFKKEIEEHRERWTFLSYHGYGSMALRDISFYLEKFKQSIDDVSVQEKGKSFQTIFEAAEQKKKEYFKKYNVDTNFQLQFRLYSKIGAVKLYRRYIQLQNFYFLDQLISKISQNCNITEELLRNLFPEEVESLLKNELTLTEEHSNRISSSAIIFSENGKEIITGNDAYEIKLKLKNLSEETTLTSDILRGDPIGWQSDSEIIKGTCKIIEFKEDRTKIIFNHNDILVCEAADLDLYDLMQIAGAVLTEQGGVTSHSATVCRENNIKSITGIKGLLENLNNNDLVEIDPNEGTVKKIALGIKELLYTAESELIQQDSLGSKAYNLIQLKKKGFNVPDFFCIPLDSLRTVLQKGTQDSLGSVNQKLWDAVNKALGNLHGELFAIRSSYSNEDSANFSGAGMNRSELHVAKEDIINTVISVASEIFFSPKNDLTGSIVIQQMILGDVSGILFSNNPVTKKENEILLEVVPGGNELLTDGKVKPIKFIIDKATKKIKEISKEQVWKDLIKEEVINEIVEKSIDIENFYAKAQDIEWTIANDSLFILQARPITNYNPDAKTPIYKIFSKANNDIISIYRSYRVPENLQAHMIQVSAVGNWIIDNWQGKKINSKDILTTLLLHDIGNLVKVPYDSFSNIFPEGYKFLPYWKAVQSWVRERYGNTDVQATSKIAKEIGVNERIIYLLENKQFVNNDLTCESADMELKICAYSDQRVSPYGIVPLKSRLQEAINRYKGNPNASVNDPKRDKLIECAEKIETQIFSSLSKIPDEINNNSINHYIKELRNFHFEN